MTVTDNKLHFGFIADMWKSCAKFFLLKFRHKNNEDLFPLSFNVEVKTDSQEEMHTSSSS